MRWQMALGLCAVVVVSGCGTLQSVNPFGGAAAIPEQGGQPKEFVVFFQSESTVLSPDAKQIIATAAAEAKANPSQHLALSSVQAKAAPGYDPKYAKARIDAVTGELLADGVRQDRIEVASSLSDAVKADASGDRRVEIHLVPR